MKTGCTVNREVVFSIGFYNQMMISGDKLRCFFIFDTSLVMLFFAYDACSVNSDYTG